jgi:hypothetical protein
MLLPKLSSTKLSALDRDPQFLRAHIPSEVWSLRISVAILTENHYLCDV